MDAQGPLADLVRQAEKLAQSPDPKLNAVIKLLKPLIENDKANPVIFCRFIATADHVAAGLRKAFPKLRIDVVTGALTSEDRRERVERWVTPISGFLLPPTASRKASTCRRSSTRCYTTTCPGIRRANQQREGRVDRFGQRAPVVRSVLLYSQDSAIDGAVLDVILRKAEAIRKATGVTVPLPESAAP